MPSLPVFGEAVSLGCLLARREGARARSCYIPWCYRAEPLIGGRIKTIQPVDVEFSLRGVVPREQRDMLIFW